ncbi:MAG: peptidoglycan-binding protein [Pseudonocardiaceae bacterium]
MPRSQNGWPANDRSLVASRRVPGTGVHLTVRTDVVGELLLYLAAQFDRRVEDIDNARGALDDWGYAERPIRGGTVLSNHASGTAIDLNAPRHPLGATATFSPAQVREIREILTECGGVVRWGGDYTGRKDEMHFEINAGSSAVAAAAARLSLGGPPVTGEAVLRHGDTGPTVHELQTALGVEVDGVFGDRTADAVREFQRRHGLTVDAIVGPQTWAALDQEDTMTPADIWNHPVPNFQGQKPRAQDVLSATEGRIEQLRTDLEAALKVLDSKLDELLAAHPDNDRS